MDMVFSPSFGNRPTRLVGREELVEGIVDGLGTRPGSKERATVLLGQRGYGKTVLLWEIADRARQQGLAVANPVAVREGMVVRVVEKLRDDAASRIRPNRRRITGGTVGALGFSAGVSLEQGDAPHLSAEGQLEHLVRDLSSQGIGSLLLVDELQANSAEVRRLVGTYQELVGEGLDVAIVLSGLPAAVSGVLNDHVLTFLNRARKKELPPLDAGDIDSFYRMAFEECGIDIPEELRRNAARAAEGSPYLMQLIGHYLVQYANGSGVVHAEDFEAALKTAAEEFRSDVCETSLAALSQGDIAYLRAAAQVAGDGELASTAQIAKHMGVTAGYGQQYRKRLLDAGLLSAPRQGEVRFAVPYLADYLRETAG